MKSKTYTISYIQSNIPCIKITGQWLKNLGFNIGDKLAFTLENGKIVLSKLSLQKVKELDMQFKSKQLEKQLLELKK